VPYPKALQLLGTRAVLREVDGEQEQQIAE
jgi:hypothetical protein